MRVSRQERRLGEETRGCHGQSRGRNPFGQCRASASPGRPIARKRSHHF